MGTWTGRELVIVVSGLDPDGEPYPASLARAAAYRPSTNTWRRVATPPTSRQSATAVWDGRDILVVGGTPVPRQRKPASAARVGFAYRPATNRWRRLAPMESGRIDVAAVWARTRLLLWGGRVNAGSAAPLIAPHGLAYDPVPNRWSPLPRAPLAGRLDPAAVWTGRSLIVWGGNRPKPRGAGTQSFTDGARFTPAAH
jgi:N-acetylneuraminic acid mutarotase